MPAALRDNAGMFLVFVALFAALSLFLPRFLSWVNLVGLMLSVSMVGMVACTMLFCMVSGDFDLSVEAVVAMSGVLAVMAINATGSVPVGIICGVAAGGAVGMVNGFVIARLGINALITTLGTMQIVHGVALISCRGVAVGAMSAEFIEMGNATLLGIPAPVWLTAACCIVFGVLLHRTRYGRKALAIGGNREAARLAGIAVVRTRITIFAVQGLMAGLAGVVLAARLASGQPNTSAGFSLEVISACVLGGVSLSGGIGTLPGVVVGVLIMGTVQNAMNLAGVPAFYQYVARGGILLAAVLFDKMRRRSGA